LYIAIALTGFILFMLPMCFRHTWIGVLMWCWLGYMMPHRLSWAVYTMPYASWIAGATLLGLLINKDMKPIPMTRDTVILLAIWAHFFVTTVFAMSPEFAWPYLLQVSKILLFTFLPLVLFQDLHRLRLFFLVIALSLGFYGLKGGIWVILSGGGSRVMMPDDAMMGGANGAGLALNMVIPLLLYLSYDEKNRWLRYLLKATFVFSIPASLFTYSRGAVLGLVAVVLVLAAKSGKFFRALAGLVILYVFMMTFAPAAWFERMDTIQNYEEDNSAISRLEAWKIAWLLALDNPFLGGGFGSVGLPEVALKYNPGKGGYNSHSIFFNVMGEHGLLGLALFCGVILSCILTLQMLRRRHRNLPWVKNYTHMLEVGFVGYAVTGAFLSAAYIDLFYHFIAATILLQTVAEREAAALAKAEKAAKAPARPGTALVHVRNRGLR
jgi:probable O-glycosylation ligase (exosortase A-associated)